VGFLAAWHPRGQPAVEVGEELFARGIAGYPRAAQFDSGTYLRRLEAICAKRPGSAPME
jgi:hypothetical protein